MQVYLVSGTEDPHERHKESFIQLEIYDRGYIAVSTTSADIRVERVSEFDAKAL